MYTAVDRTKVRKKMYSRIKILEITRTKIIFDNDNTYEPLTIELNSPITYDDKFFVIERNIIGIGDDGQKYYIRCFKNNVYITDSMSEHICKIYVPQKVKYLIEKDINKSGVFSLEYRKHLRTDYSSDKHIFLAFNYIPEEFEDLVDKAKEKCKQYSTGVYNQPILCVYMDNENERLFFGIVKDSIPVESGYLEHTILPE